MLRIPVQSRKGNFALVVLGIIYSLGAVAVLAWFVIDVDNAAARLDRLMQMSLLGAALFGIWSIVNALANLGMLRRGLPHFHRSSGAH